MEYLKNKKARFLNLKRRWICSILITMTVIIPTGINAQTDSIVFDGMQRYYKLHVPESYGIDSVPLMVAIHGWARRPELMEYHSHLSDKADKEGFIVVYPEGTGSPLEWNTSEEGVDDAGFINALIDSITTNYAIDTNRIYLTGFSNGAELVYKVAQQYGQKIAGIAPVACYYWNENVEPVKAIPIITFHAQNDGSVSISGVQPVLDNWIGFNGCDTVPEVFYEVPGAQGKRWLDTINDNTVVFFSTEVGGHSWPGGEMSWATPSNAISATDLMWDFFTNGLITALPVSRQDSLHFGDTTRYYNMHIPSLYKTNDTASLIIAIHGWARSPELMEEHTHMSDKADKEGFIVVYPEGTSSPLEWNTSEEGVDDAGFINALIDSIAANYAIDTNRVYLTGFSNGAELVYKVAQQYGQKIAGIAPVACYYWNENVEPVKAIPIITFHAQNDGSVPISGVQPVLDNWIDFNDASSTPDTFYMVEGATGIRWLNEEDGNHVVFFSTEVGGHSWPGGEPSWATPSDVISATDLMWDFFKRELPEVIDLPNITHSFVVPSDNNLAFSIHPNPAKKYVQITDFGERGIVQVWSIQGVLYSSYPATPGDDVSIDVTGLSNGIYFLTFSTIQGNSMQKRLVILH